MLKKIVLLVIIILVTGCISNNDAGIYLTDKYYNSGEFITVNSNGLKDDEIFILYTYNNYCSLPIHCENIFKEFMEKYNIDFLSMPYAEFRKTKYHDVVKYAPSIIVIDNGKIISYLDANSKEDLEKYQDVKKFEKWLYNYISFKRK